MGGESSEQYVYTRGPTSRLLTLFPLDAPGSETLAALRTKTVKAIQAGLSQFFLLLQNV